MKKFISLLIGCSLALAGAAMAQQPDQQSSPTKKQPAAEKTKPAETQPGVKAPKPHEPAVKEPGAGKHEGAASKGQNVEAAPKSEASPGPKTNVSGQPAGAQTPSARQQRIEERRKGMKGPAAAAKTATSPAAPAAPSADPRVAPAGQQDATG